MIVCLSNNADDITNSKTPKPKPKQTAINRHFEQVSEFVAILRYGLVCTDISLFHRCGINVATFIIICVNRVYSYDIDKMYKKVCHLC